MRFQRRLPAPDSLPQSAAPSAVQWTGRTSVASRAAVLQPAVSPLRLMISMTHASRCVLAGLALLAASACFIGPPLSLFLASDACLGAGGSYDFAGLRCDFQRSHPYAPFALPPFQVAALGTVLGAASIAHGLLRLWPGNASMPERAGG